MKDKAKQFLDQMKAKGAGAGTADISPLPDELLDLVSGAWSNCIGGCPPPWTNGWTDAMWVNFNR